MRQKINSLLDISDSFDTYFVDMFGVIWDGYNFYPEVPVLFAALKAKGKKIVMLSNATMLTFQMEAKAAAHGLMRGTHYDDFITSGEVFFQKIRHGFLTEFADKKDFTFYVIGTDNHTLFEDVSSHQTRELEKADFIYISSLDTAEGYAFTLDRFIPEMQRGIALKKPAICANPDVTVVRDNVPHFVNGAAAGWYENHGGKVLYIGKPYPEIFEYALDRTESICAKSVMIGDSLSTDILGANRMQMASVLITKTGVTADNLKGDVSLEDLCQKMNACPTFILPTIGAGLTLRKEKE